MALQFIIGRSGSDKAEHMYKKILKAAGENQDKNYIVIVPEQYTLSTQKKLVHMSETKAILNVDVLSFNRLAYRVFDEIGIKADKALDDAGKSYIICGILKKRESELSMLGRASDKMGYIDEIKSFISELMQYRVKPEELEEASEKYTGSPGFCEKLKDISIVYDEYLKYLDGGYVTAENILELLRENVYSSGIIKNSFIMFDGFTGFTPVQNSVLEELLKYSRAIYITLNMPGNLSGMGRVDESELFYLPLKTADKLTAVCERIRCDVLSPYIYDGSRMYDENPEMDFLERHLFRNDNAVYDGEPEHIHINAFKDMNEELAYAAATISRLVREKGYCYRDFAIVCPDVKRAVETGTRVFSDADIPFFADVKSPAIKNAFSEGILMLLGMIERDFSYESVSAYIKSGLSGIDGDESDILENYILAKGIRGFKRYEEPWILVSGNMDAEDLLRVNLVREKFVSSLKELRAALHTSKTGVREKLVALYEHFAKNGYEEKLLGYSKALEEDGDRSAAKYYEIIYRRVMDVFDDLAELLGDERISLKEFTRLVKAGLSSIKLGIVPTGRDQVTVCDIERSRTENIKVLFLIGANDGQIPKTVSKGGILSETEAAILKDGGMELSMSMKERVFIQRYYLYLILTKPSKELYVSYSRTGSENESLKRSYLVDYIASVFKDIRIKSTADFDDLYFMQTKSAAYEYFLKSYEKMRYSKSGALSAFAALFGDGLSNACDKTDTADDRLSHELTGSIYGERLALSVTSLERFAACPYSYFLKYGMRLVERERYSFLPMDFGNILHDALDGFCSVMEESGMDFSTVDEKHIEEFSERAFENAMLKVRNDYLMSSARAMHLRLRMNRIFKRMLKVIKTETKESGFVPKYHEIKFGEYSDIDSAVYKVDGGEIILKGKIDRIDLLQNDENNRFRVVDYKTGSSVFDRVMFENGLSLQLPLYIKIAGELVRRDGAFGDVRPEGGYYAYVADPIVDKSDNEKDGIIKPLRLNGFELEQGEKMLKDLDAGIEDIGERIFSGESAKIPYEYKGKNACTYCEFKNSCSFEAEGGALGYRRLIQ